MCGHASCTNQNSDRLQIMRFCLQLVNVLSSELLPELSASSAYGQLAEQEPWLGHVNMLLIHNSDDILNGPSKFQADSYLIPTALCTYVQFTWAEQYLYLSSAGNGFSIELQHKHSQRLHFPLLPHNRIWTSSSRASWFMRHGECLEMDQLLHQFLTLAHMD